MTKAFTRLLFLLFIISFFPISLVAQDDEYNQKFFLGICGGVETNMVMPEYVYSDFKSRIIPGYFAGVEGEYLLSKKFAVSSSVTFGIKNLELNETFLDRRPGGTMASTEFINKLSLYSIQAQGNLNIYPFGTDRAFFTGAGLTLDYQIKKGNENYLIINNGDKFPLPEIEIGPLFNASLRLAPGLRYDFWSVQLYYQLYFSDISSVFSNLETIGIKGVYYLK